MGVILGPLPDILGLFLVTPMVMSPVVSPLGSGLKPMSILRPDFGSMSKSKAPISPVTLRAGGLPNLSLIDCLALPGPRTMVVFDGFLPNIVTWSLSLW